jgi:hypothetical protein
MDDIEIGQIWKSNSSPWTVRIIELRKGHEWVDNDLEIVQFEGVYEDDEDGLLYMNHFLQMFHLLER